MICICLLGLPLTCLLCRPIAVKANRKIKETTKICAKEEIRLKHKYLICTKPQPSSLLSYSQLATLLPHLLHAIENDSTQLASFHSSAFGIYSGTSYVCRPNGLVETDKNHQILTTNFRYLYPGPKSQKVKPILYRHH